MDEPVVDREQWKITDIASSDGQVNDGVACCLLNTVEGQKLRYGERRFGINLDWGVQPGITNVRIERLKGSGGLRAGDSVAIRIDGGGYLAQGFRAIGPSLEWRSAPVYHWMIRTAAGSDGSPITEGMPVSIFAKTRNDSLVYESHQFGINLGWKPENPGEDGALGGAPSERRREWIVSGNPPGSSQIVTGQPYRMVNRTAGEAIEYGERKVGLNLVWSAKDSPLNIRFEQKSGPRQPVRFGASFAIHVDGGDYLTYGTRAWGVDMVWSESPAYEWRFRGTAGSNGAAVQTDREVQLSNSRADASLIYEKRLWGINLEWLQEHRAS